MLKKVLKKNVSEHSYIDDQNIGYINGLVIWQHCKPLLI